MQSPDPSHLRGSADEPPAVPPAIEPSIADEIAAVDERRAALLLAASVRIGELLVELAGLTQIVGPLTRDQIPDCVLRRRRAKKPSRAPRAKKEKGAPDARP